MPGEGGTPAAPESGLVRFYRWEDASGAHFVDRLEKVPEAARGKAEHYDLPKEAAPALDSALRTLEARAAELSVGQRIDGPSFALGFGLALIVALGLRLLLGGLRLALKLALVAVLVLLLGGAYLAWVRQGAGLADGRWLSEPQTLIEDAKRAGDDAKKVRSELERVSD